ncbi:MAG: hypothetical protein AAGI27_00570 [Pseudomonadota bacterium]
MKKNKPSMLGLPLLLLMASSWAGDGATGIIQSIRNAPVIADGNVAGQPLDVLITLDGSLDPNSAGRSLMTGDTIRVVFPPEFDLGNIDPAYPLNNIPFPFPPPPASPLPERPCLPGNLQCTTAVILKGWPQNPLFPPILSTTLSVDLADNALVFTAARDITESPGIKQLHLILNGVTNPAPGNYRIRVEAETGPGGSLETGEALLRIIKRAAPSINPTSVFVKALSGQLEGGVACGPGTNPPNADNPVYQDTLVNSAAPFAWTFILWGRDGVPLDNVHIERVSRNYYRLVRDNPDARGPWWRRLRERVVGHIKIDAPPGARHQLIEQIDCPGSLPQAPVIAATPGIGPQPAGRLDLQFHAGDTPGVYTSKLWLVGGNVTTKVVTAD